MLYARLLQSDEDWNSLRQDPRFRQLAAKVQKADKSDAAKEGDEDGDIIDAD